MLYVLFWICVLLVIVVMWCWILVFIDGVISIVFGYCIEWFIDLGFVFFVVLVVVVWINVGYVLLFFLVGLMVIL